MADQKIIDNSQPISELGDNKSGEEVEKNTENIEKNIKIRTMPKKFKVSVDSATSGKTKVIGAIIMVVGVLVLAVLIYFAYIYLINPEPKEEPKAKAPVEKEEPTVEEKPVTPPEEKIEEVEKEPIIPPEEEIEEVLATTTEEETATTTEEEVEEEIDVVDTDEDGLSDMEEKLFGSNINLADTDDDGYGDGAEVGNLYNPAGSGKLVDNEEIDTHFNDSFNYSVLHPKRWVKQSPGDESSVIFAANNGSFIQIISQPNEGNKSIKSWFEAQFPEEVVDEKNIISKNDFEGIFHKTKKIFYLTDENKKNIFVISYVPEPEDSMDYYNIFKMMIDSFSITN